MRALLGIALFGFSGVEMSYFFMYIGVVQIVLQGVLIGILTKRWGKKNLIILGSLLMMLGVFIMSLISNIVVFLVCLTMFSSGFGALNTVLPTFISERTATDE